MTDDPKEMATLVQNYLQVTEEKSEEAFENGDMSKAQAWSLASEYLAKASDILNGLAENDLSVVSNDPSVDVDEKGSKPDPMGEWWRDR